MRLRLALVLAILAAAILASFPAAGWAAPSAADPAHTHLSFAGATDPVVAQYGRGAYLFDTVRFCGSALSGDSVLSVADLEELALDDGLGLGYANRYSLMTSGSVFSIFRFEGVKLAGLLLRLGLDPSAPGSTPIRVYAADGYSMQFTLAQITQSSRYACYPAKTDPTVLEADLPVLLSFASEGVPLVGPTPDEPVTRVFEAADGYVQAADNSGGPIRLTLGQTTSDDFNARFNVKWVTKVVVGEDTEPVHAGVTGALAARELTVRVLDTSAQVAPLKTVTFTAGEIEAWSQSLTTRGFYDDGDAGGAYYQGVDLWRLLAERVGLPGYEGTAEIEASGGETATVDLAYLRNLGRDHAAYTVSRTVTPPGGSSTPVTVTGLHPVLAYAKNGAPMVAGPGDPGYQATGVAGAVVDNDGGPLSVLLPRDGEHLVAGVFLAGVTRIDLDVRVPADLHTGPVYGAYDGEEITLEGEGIKSPGPLTVGQLEQRVDLMLTYDYGTDPVATGATGSCHGVDLLQLLKGSALGLAVDAGTVTVAGADGETVSFTVDDLEAADEPVLLAFSREGVPLVRGVSAGGYDLAASNDGGPVRLVSRLWTVSDVVSITVSLQAGVWTHAEKPYSAYLQRAISVSGSEVAGTTVLTLADLEALASVRDSFAASKGVSAYQGVELRDLIEDRLATGVTAPTGIRVYGADGYFAELPVGQVLDGIDSTYQPGQRRDVILAYAKNGYPLVSGASSDGYVASAFNDDGPVHLVVENTISSWVKDVRAIVVGEGDPVYVPDRVAAKRVRIVSPTAGQTVAYVAPGQMLRLRAALSPVAATDAVTWTSGDPRRATVSRSGVVTARTIGRVRITARAASGKKDAIVLVVKRRRDAVSVSLPGRRRLEVGQALTLVARLGPARATSLVAWRSSDTTVVTVDAGGRLVARSAGAATVSVRTANGLRAACRIVVRLS